MGKQWLFNVKGCITQGGNGPKLKTTKEDENKREPVNLGVAWSCLMARSDRAKSLPSLPSYLHVARFGVILFLEEKLCQRGFS